MAVIFSFKKFLVCALSSNSFNLVTDHQAPLYAFKKKDIHGRRACWLEFVAEYELIVEYPAGSSNYAADYLS